MTTTGYVTHTGVVMTLRGFIVTQGIDGNWFTWVPEPNCLPTHEDETCLAALRRIVETDEETT